MAISDLYTSDKSAARRISASSLESYEVYSLRILSYTLFFFLFVAYLYWHMYLSLTFYHLQSTFNNLMFLTHRQQFHAYATSANCHALSTIYAVFCNLESRSLPAAKTSMNDSSPADDRVHEPQRNLAPPAAPSSTDS